MRHTLFISKLIALQIIITVLSEFLLRLRVMERIMLMKSFSSRRSLSSSGRERGVKKSHSSPLYPCRITSRTGSVSEATSRQPQDIEDEIRRLVDDGVSEVMLLGQNVNSYGKTLDDPLSFAALLRRVEKIDGLEHWIGLVDDVLRLLKAWIKSDKERRYRLLQQRAIRLAKLETEVQSLKSMPFGIVENNTNNARNQWLRSPNPGNANNPRIVNSSGAVNNNNANNSNAVAPDCMDSRTE